MGGWNANKAQSKPATHTPLAMVSGTRKALLPTEAFWLLVMRTQAASNLKPLKGHQSPGKHGKPEECSMSPASPILCIGTCPSCRAQAVRRAALESLSPSPAGCPGAGRTVGPNSPQGWGLPSEQAARSQVQLLSQAPLPSRNTRAGEVLAMLKDYSPNQTVVTVNSSVHCHYLCLLAGVGVGVERGVNPASER